MTGANRVEVLVMFIPDALKQLPQWVCWRYETRDGKATKVPYDARTGNKAAVNKPDTWTDFDTAFRTYDNNEFYSGIGFVLTTDDPFVGVDLDHCLDDKGKPEPWAQTIVEQFKSYTEVTPSGKGLRIFIEGNLAGTGRKKGNVEIYNQGRFLTVTGGIL